MKVLVLPWISCFVAAGTPSAKAVPFVQTVSYAEVGSVPHAYGMYACARALQGQPFDEHKTNACVDELLATNAFEQVSFSLHDAGAGTVNLTFNLKSRELVLTLLQFELPEQQKNDLGSWLSKDPDSFALGKAYTERAKVATFDGIQNFFRLHGQAILVSTSTALDYAQGTAQVAYRFVLGPKTPREAIVAGLENCPHPITDLDLTGIDEDAPFPLVSEIMNVRAFSCFDKDLLAKDEKRLMDSGFIKAAHFSTEADGQGWIVRLSVHGEPLTVSGVDVVGFGANLSLSPSELATLPLRTGQRYRNSLAGASSRRLEEMFADAHQIAQVVSRGRLLEGRRVQVEFDVLVSPKDEVLINGKRY
jgi:hypothetical protein